MRKLIVAAVLVLTCLLITAAWNVNFLVERNQDFLLGQLGRALGHPISAEKIVISYRPLALHMTNLVIADDPADAANPLVRAKYMRISLRVLPLLLGRFRPDKISLDSPAITIVRDADGRYNYQTQRENKKSDPNQTNRRRRTPSEGQLLPIVAAQITDGTLHYRDLKNDGELAVSQIELRVSDFDEDEPLEVRLSAAVNSAKPNLNFNVSVGPIAGIRDFRDYPIIGDLNAEQLDLGKVNRALPQFKRATPKFLRFEGIYDIKDLKFTGTLKNPSLKGAVHGTDASFRFD